jgi:phage tail sheath gpL-like
MRRIQIHLAAVALAALATSVSADGAKPLKVLSIPGTACA